MTAARQQATQDGSETSLATCELAVSQFLLDEPGADDADRATERFAPLGSIPLLDATPDAPESARALMESHLIPPRNETDAAHTAAATVHNMQFLLTWNCTYLANAEISARLQVIRAKLHHAALIVRSPEALLGAR